MQRRCAAGNGHGFGRADGGGKRLLELLDLWPSRQPVALQDLDDCRNIVRLDPLMRVGKPVVPHRRAAIESQSLRRLVHKSCSTACRSCSVVSHWEFWSLA